MKRLLLTGVALCATLFSATAQDIYNNELNDAYYSYAKEAWGDVSAVAPIIDFDQAWNDEGVLDIALAGAGGENDNGDRFVYAFTELMDNQTVPINLDFSEKMTITIAIKSDVAFDFGVYLSDKNSVWNDKEAAKTISLEASSEFVVYELEFESAYTNWEDTDLSMDMISNLGFVFNEGEGGLAVTANLAIDYIKVTPTSILGIDGLSSLQFSTFPNPTTNNVKVQFEQNVDGQLGVYNLAGQELLTQSVSGNEATIDLGNLDAGQYILNITTDYVSEARKVVKF